MEKKYLAILTIYTRTFGSYVKRHGMLGRPITPLEINYKAD